MQTTTAGRDVEPMFRQFRSPLTKRALLLTRDRDEADDLVQDTFERALRHPEILTGRDDGGQRWLETTLRNLFIDRWRTQKARPDRLSLGADQVPASDPEPAPAWDEVTLPDVEAAVAELPESLRAIFTLRHMAGLGYHELECRLRLRPGTVATRLLRARRRVRQLVLSRVGAAARGA